MRLLEVELVGNCFVNKPISYHRLAGIADAQRHHK